MKQAISILGSTGSIGVSTLDVVKRHPDLYRVFALSAFSRMEALAKQCQEFQPRFAVAGTSEAAKKLKQYLVDAKLDTEVLVGADALCEVASAKECDVVMAAIVGAAGLASSLAAAKAGKKILLANKEALVMSGQLFIDAVKKYNATLLPIDSEHNAIFQCLPHPYSRSLPHHGIAKILLTASGGPFLHRTIDSLDDVTPEQAVAHPKWVMGRKISVDSATMMNKGLEVIEAHWLFGAPSSNIEVVIHPQSVIHSMVSYNDGSVLAELGNPDMRIPIAHAMAFPERFESGVTQLDLIKIGQLTFEKPDFKRFPCLKLAYDVLDAKGSASVTLNAANEIAVDAFLNRRIGFRKIDQIIDQVLNKLPNHAVEDLDALLEQDKLARETALTFIS